MTDVNSLAELGGAAAQTSQRGTLSSLERGLRILSYVQDRGPVAVSEVVADLDIPTSSAYRYTTALVAQGYLVEMDGLLVASARLAESATGLAHVLPQVATRVMDTLVSMTGLSVTLTSRVHMASVCLAARRLNYAPLAHRKGQALALNSGASATPLLAFAPESIRARVLASRLMVFTALTPTKAQLPGIIEQIRVDGHHVTHGWLTPGMAGAGVPIFVEGECVAAISVIGQIQAIGDGAGVLPELKQASETITRLVRSASESPDGAGVGSVPAARVGARSATSPTAPATHQEALA